MEIINLEEVLFIERKIKELALQFGADVCGIGSINRFVNAPAGFSPLDLFDKCKSVIALGIALPKPAPCNSPSEYWDAENMTAKGLISMKHTAYLCGLGSIGKSSLLINPEYGNRLTIGAILTDLELESDDLQPDLCIAGCGRCTDSCPVQAIADGRVNQKLCRTNTYGKTARGFDTIDCNKCRNVCPMRFGKTR